MTNQKLYLIPTTPSYENEKDILRTSNRENIYYQQMYHCHIDTNVY